LEADIPGGGIDNISRIMRMDRYRGVEKKWEEAKRKYEAAQEQKKKRVPNPGLNL